MRNPSGLYAQIWAHLSGRQRRWLFVILTLAIFNSALEVILVACTAVFGSALLAPDRFLGRNRLVALLSWLGHPPTTIGELLLAAGLLSLAAIAVKATVSLASAYLNSRFTFWCYRTLARQAFATLLGRPYVWHLKANSALLVQALLQDLASVQLLISFAVALGSDVLMIVLLFFVLTCRAGVSVLVACAAAVVTSLLIYRFCHRTLLRLAQQEHQWSQSASRVVTQSVHGVKDLKIVGREDVFIHSFENTRRHMERLRAWADVMRIAPRQLIELLGFAALVCIMALLSSRGLGDPQMVATMSMFGVAFLRILPAISRSLTNLATISSTLPSGAAGLKLLEQLAESGPLLGQPALRVDFLEFQDVSFQYEDGRPALQGVDFKVGRGQRLGLVGQSGGGKTTLADLICGLLEPTTGTILVNGQPFAEPLYRTRRVGYVLQAPFLFEGSVAENLTFSFDTVDEARAWQCLEAAQLADVVRGLEGGLAAPMGERGARLSGGQAQRLAIARSLYSQPDVLILDEATSALDSITEGAFLDSLDSLAEVILVIIAHRMTAVRECDVILILRDGRVVDSGRHEELVQRCPYYRELLSQEEQPVAGSSP